MNLVFRCCIVLADRNQWPNYSSFRRHTIPPLSLPASTTISILSVNIAVSRSLRVIESALNLQRAPPPATNALRRSSSRPVQHCRPTSNRSGGRSSLGGYVAQFRFIRSPNSFLWLGDFLLRSPLQIWRA